MPIISSNYLSYFLLRSSPFTSFSVKKNHSNHLLFLSSSSTASSSSSFKTIPHFPSQYKKCHYNHLLFPRSSSFFIASSSASSSSSTIRITVNVDSFKFLSIFFALAKKLSLLSSPVPSSFFYFLYLLDPLRLL